MSLELWWGFVIATVVVTLVPGPSMLMVIGHALSRGSTMALASVTGVVCADAVLLSLAAGGLGALLETSALAFEVLKWAGALYLVYLGVSQWREAGRMEDVDPYAAGEDDPNEPVPPGQRFRSACSLFRDAFMVTMVNPKIIGFFVAFFPQFVEPQRGPVQFVVLAATFLTMVFVIMAAYGYLAGVLAKAWIRPGRQRLAARLSGATLVAAGLLTAAVRKG